MSLRVYLRNYRYPSNAQPVDPTARVGEVFAKSPAGELESVLMWVFTCDQPGCGRQHIVCSVDFAERRLTDGREGAETSWPDVTNAIDAWLRVERIGWRAPEIGGHACNGPHPARATFPRPFVADVSDEDLQQMLTDVLQRRGLQ